MKQSRLFSPSLALVMTLSVFSHTALAQSADATYIGSRVDAGTSSSSAIVAALISPAQGNTTPETPPTNSVVAAVTNFYLYFMTQLKADWSAPQPNLPQVSANNAAAVQLATQQSSAPNSLTASTLTGEIGLAVNKSLGNALGSLFAGDVLPPTQQQVQQALQSGYQGSSPSALQNCGNAMFNFESLMGYSTYAGQVLPCNPNAQPSDVSLYANHYIQWAANLAMPPATFSLNQAVSQNVLTSSQAAALQASPEWASYDLSLRHVVSVQSAGLSNLYYLYSQRAPADKNGNSPESLANYTANWRVQDPNWYTTMQSALPTVIARETLFVLAEMQRDLHEMRKENQRMLAVQSVIALQSIETYKVFLNMKLAAVKDKMNNMLNPPAPPSATNAGTTSTDSNGVPKTITIQGKTYDTGAPKINMPTSTQGN